MTVSQPFAAAGANHLELLSGGGFHGPGGSIDEPSVTFADGSSTGPSGASVRAACRRPWRTGPIRQHHQPHRERRRRRRHVQRTRVRGRPVHDHGRRPGRRNNDRLRYDAEGRTVSGDQSARRQHCLAGGAERDIHPIESIQVLQTDRDGVGLFDEDNNCPARPTPARPTTTATGRAIRAKGTTTTTASPTGRQLRDDANTDQANNDGDADGDACDADDDNDGVADGAGQLPETATPARRTPTAQHGGDAAIPTTTTTGSRCSRGPGAHPPAGDRDGDGDDDAATTASWPPTPRRTPTTTTRGRL